MSDTPESLTAINWDIRREGRAWTAEEVGSRWQLTPEKLELIEGKIFWSDEQRLVMLALLLEQVGADKAVRLGDPSVWRSAVADLPFSEERSAPAR